MVDLPPTSKEEAEDVDAKLKAASQVLVAEMEELIRRAKEAALVLHRSRPEFSRLENRRGGEYLPRRRTMRQFIKHFRREGVGVWVCIAPATLDLPQGRVQVAEGSRFTLGTMFMNIELASLLEVEYQQQQNRPPS